MGESREGGGRAEGPTLIQVMASIFQQYREDEREIGRIEVQRVTEGVASFEIQLHGEPEPEEVVVFGFDRSSLIEPSTPIGGNSPGLGGV